MNAPLLAALGMIAAGVAAQATNRNGGGYPDDIRIYDDHPGSSGNDAADAFRAASGELEGLQCLLQDAWDRVATDVSEDDAEALTAFLADLRPVFAAHLPMLRDVAEGKWSLEALANLKKGNTP